MNAQALPVSLIAELQLQWKFPRAVSVHAPENAFAQLLVSAGDLPTAARQGAKQRNQEELPPNPPGLPQPELCTVPVQKPPISIPLLEDDISTIFPYVSSDATPDGSEELPLSQTPAAAYHPILPATSAAGGVAVPISTPASEPAPVHGMQSPSQVLPVETSLVGDSVESTGEEVSPDQPVLPQDCIAPSDANRRTQNVPQLKQAIGPKHIQIRPDQFIPAAGDSATTCEPPLDSADLKPQTASPCIPTPPDTARSAAGDSNEASPLSPPPNSPPRITGVEISAEGKTRKTPPSNAIGLPPQEKTKPVTEEVPHHILRSSGIPLAAAPPEPSPAGNDSQRSDPATAPIAALITTSDPTPEAPVTRQTGGFAPAVPSLPTRPAEPSIPSLAQNEFTSRQDLPKAFTPQPFSVAGTQVEAAFTARLIASASESPSPAERLQQPSLDSDRRTIAAPALTAQPRVQPTTETAAPPEKPEFEDPRVDAPATDKPRRFERVAETPDIIVSKPEPHAYVPPATSAPADQPARTSEERPAPEIRQAAAAHEATRQPEPPLNAPVRDIRLQFSADDGRIQVRMAERAGEVRVTVHAPDQDVSSALRADLPVLADRLEQAGFRTETWHGAVPQHSESPHFEAAPGAPQQDSPDPRQHNFEQQQQENPQQQHRTAEDEKPRPKQPDDFSWLFESLGTNA